MNHNNIYSILGKLESLEAKHEPKTEQAPQQIYESVESKGSILEGVDAIEARLKQKFSESGLQYYTGKKKYGKDGMAALAKAGREGANQEELGRIKDKFIKKEDMEEAVCKECGMTEGSCGHSKMEESACPTCGMKNCKCDHAKMKEEKTTHKGGEVSHKDGVTKHTKKDYPGYQSDSDEEDDDGEKKVGRPRKHAKKADTGEKKGRGRPKKEKAPEYDKRHDPFGRVKSGAEKSGEKGKKVAGKAMSGSLEEKAVSQAQQKFMGMVYAAKKGDKAASPDVAKAAKGMSKKSARDFAATKHKGLPQHVNEGINFAEMLKEKHATVDEMLAELSNDIKLFKETGHCSELLRDCMDLRGYAAKKMSEVAQIPSNPDPFHATKGTDLVSPQQRVAGATPAKPGVMGAVKDVAKGLKNFFTGKPDSGPTYETAMDAELNELARLAGLNTEGNAFTGKLKDTPKGGEFELDGKKYKDTSNLDEEPNEGNAFTGKLAATKKGEKFELDGKEFTDTSSLEEEKIDVKDAPESKNKPKPKYASIKSITTQGDDMHREKSQHPGAAAKGDNPLTNEAVSEIEAKLSAEYESIKKSVR